MAADGTGAGSATTPAVDAVFAALADPTRRHLLERISTDGPISATELSVGQPITRQAVVKHVSALHGAGLVRSERRGREVLFTVEPARLDPVAQWLGRIGRLWDQRLVALVKNLSDHQDRTGP